MALTSRPASITSISCSVVVVVWDIKWKREKKVAEDCWEDGAEGVLSEWGKAKDEDS